MVTVIRDQDSFAFIHIPKCAGMSIELGLESAFPDRTDGETWHDGTIIHDPRFGRYMPAHKPLRMIENYFPDELDRYRRCECFAVTRDPKARFASSFQQYLRQFRHTNINNLSPPEIMDEVHRVIRALEQGETARKVEYVHFIRQVDFVSLGTERVVQNLFPLDRLDELAKAMGAVTERKIDLRKKSNQSGTKSSGARFLARKIGTISKRWLPASVYEPIRIRALERLHVPTDPEKLELLSHSDIQNFVKSYYATDRELHEEVKRNATADRFSSPFPATYSR